jgi:hypothetical protein
MKAKKALKKLKRVESLLSSVIHEYAAKAHSVRELLDSAKASVVRAQVRVTSQRAARKPQLKVTKRKRWHLSAEARQKISLAAKKRWALAKRNSRRKNFPKSSSTTPPIMKRADRPLVPEAPSEPKQERHEPQVQ